MTRKLTTLVVLAISALCFSACCSNVCPDEKTPVDYVSVLTGTMSKPSFSTGNTYPAIARPWGMNFWSPQTGPMGSGWLYCYNDEKIKGFRQVHQPSPWIGDYGQFSIMPETNDPVFDENERASWFSHKAETATPYFYSVYLAEYDTFVEMAPTERAAAFRITYPERELSYLVVDAFDRGSYTEVKGNKISGYTVRNNGGCPEGYTNYFVVESDTPFTYVDVIEGDHSGAIVGFKTDRGQKVNLKVASSFISLEQAEQNLKELDGKDVDVVKEEGRALWNELLGRFEIEDNDYENKCTFYSCLYRALLFPRDLSEITADGKRVHRSPHDNAVYDGYMFTDTGFWDTFRSLFSLLDFAYPEVSEKVQEGLVNDYLESGFLPEWASPGHRGCMVGNNSASVVAEAYIKGRRGYDTETLWQALVHDANANHPKAHSTGRRGYEYYNELGYVPCDVGINENAARTLEYAYDDWCIYKFGKAIGKSEDEIKIYADRAMNYKKLYRPEYGMMSGRNADGSFPEEFNPYKWGGNFTEGNAIQYTWSVFHDPAGLIELMGGKEQFGKNMDRMFDLPPIFDESYYGVVIHEIREMQVMNTGNYAHGNQPVQHAIYLYDWCGQPWKAQKWTRYVMDHFYNANPDGYCGDEDNGQTSAWYVFSAMGMYPVCPAGTQYALGSPLFKKLTVHLPNGKDVVFSAPENAKENVYVQSMKLDGKNYTANYLEHETLMKGCKINYVMGAEPETTRGTADADLPYSFSEEYNK